MLRCVINNSKGRRIIVGIINEFKKQTMQKNQQKGFTLIEILVVMGLIALLAAIVLIAINPARQFAQGRNSQRTSNVNTIINAIGQNMADNKGIFTCGAIALPAITETDANKDISLGKIDLRSCLVPTYISEIPLDPGTSDASYTAGDNTCTQTPCEAGKTYDTKYTVGQDGTSKRITVCAPNAAHESAISLASSICTTR